jgi:hypothetical protein
MTSDPPHLPGRAENASGNPKGKNELKGDLREIHAHLVRGKFHGP